MPATIEQNPQTQPNFYNQHPNQPRVPQQLPRPNFEQGLNNIPRPETLIQQPAVSTFEQGSKIKNRSNTVNNIVPFIKKESVVANNIVPFERKSEELAVSAMLKLPLAGIEAQLNFSRKVN